MKLEISLDDALAKARPGLRYRMEQSVALIRKAEKLAKMYDAENGFYLAFSGGKDSQVLYHIAELSGVAFRGHFSPTSIDPPQVIRFIRRNYPEIEFEKIHQSIYDMAIEKRIFPTQRFRWCCAEFKEVGGAGKVVLTGVRHAESAKRAKRQEVEVSGRKFSGTIEDFQNWRVEQLEKKNNGVNHDEFARDKEQEVACISGKDKVIVNPLVDWSDSDVWDFLNKVIEVPHCELYDPPFNQHRVGCIMCPMQNPKQKRREAQMYPYVYNNWVKVAEKFIRGGVLPRVEKTVTQLWAERRSIFGNGGGISLPPMMKKRLPNLLVDWWISGLSWDEFVDKQTNPNLFEEE